MGNRQKCAKFQENLFRSNEIISIFCPPLFPKRPITECSGLLLCKTKLFQSRINTVISLCVSLFKFI